MAHYSAMHPDEGADAGSNQETESESELRELNDKLSEAVDAVTQKEEELRKVKLFWETRQGELQAQVETTKNKVEALEDKLFVMEHHARHGRPPPPGPKSLRWVDGSTFNMFCLGIVGVNMVTLTLEVVGRKESKVMALADHFFLAFYLVEMVLRICYHRKGFFVGDIGTVWWNWLDILIVLTGVGGNWVYPLMFGQNENTAYSDLIRGLRLARFVRAVKIFHLIYSTDMAWTESLEFQSFMMGVISFNAILMGLEIEYPGYKVTWNVLEQILLVLFFFELVLRLRYLGIRTFFTKEGDVVWNWLDFIIVAGGVLDQWIMPTISLVHSYMVGSAAKNQHDGFSQAMRLLRMARLLRILRLVKLIKNIPPLYTLVVGIAKAMQGMSWVMLLTVTVLYISALLGVKLVGPRGLLLQGLSDESEDRRLHGHAGGSNTDDGGDDEEVHTWDSFPNMFDAMFNLFKAMQCDLDAMEPLFNWSPLSKYVMMFFVILTNWAIFSILTAVVSDEMAKVTEEHETEVQNEEAKVRNVELVEKIFNKYAADSGPVDELSKADFQKLLDNALEKEELCTAAGLSSEDLQEFFDILSEQYENNDDLKIKRQAFLDGLEKERAEVNQRSMMKLEKRLDDMDTHIKSNMHQIEDLLSKVLRQPIARASVSQLTSFNFSPHHASSPNRW